jgi:hypothetical protein
MSRAQLTSTVEQNSAGAASPFLAGKNKIINGDFGVWQRGTSFSGNGNATADRYIISFTGTGAAITTSQQTFTPGTAPTSGYEGTYFCRNVVTGGSDTTAGYVFMTQKIEDVRQFAGQTVTFSFWAKAASGTPGLAVDIYQDFGTGGSAVPSVTGNKVTLSTSWARYTITTAIPSIAGKTIGTGSNLAVRMWFSGGSNYNANTGSLGTQSNTFDIWGWQVESGSVATPFTTASGTVQGELALCQRYLPVFGGGPSGSSTDIQGYASSTTAANFYGTFAVQPRTTPTGITLSALSNYRVYNVSNVSGNPTALTFTEASLQTFQLISTTTAGSPTIVQGQPVDLYMSVGQILFTGCEL